MGLYLEIVGEDGRNCRGALDNFLRQHGRRLTPAEVWAYLLTPGEKLVTQIGGRGGPAHIATDLYELERIRRDDQRKVSFVLADAVLEPYVGQDPDWLRAQRGLREGAEGTKDALQIMGGYNYIERFREPGKN